MTTVGGSHGRNAKGGAIGVERVLLSVVSISVDISDGGEVVGEDVLLHLVVGEEGLPFTVGAPDSKL